jgi:hypothetical protein
VGALLGVVFCVNFGPFFFFSFVPLPSVIILFIHLFIGNKRRQTLQSTNASDQMQIPFPLHKLGFASYL